MTRVAGQTLESGLTGRSICRTTEATSQLNRNASARTQRWKIVQPLGKATDPMPTGAKFELYDMSVDPGETKNLASEHPEIVEQMRRGYEEWFRDVSSQGFEPVRIHLGSPREPRTTLSRFDWRGDYDDRAGEDALGHWPVVIAQQGRYDLVLRFAEPLPSEGWAQVVIGDVKVAKEVAAGSASCEFSSIVLETGPTRLEGLVEYESIVRGASFVDVALVE